MVTVVCTRWFDAFPVSYVRVLRNAVREYLREDHQFICVTDNPESLDADIETRLIPDMGLPTIYKKTGCWPKLSLFAPGLLPPDEPTLFLDLDLLIRSDLSPFIERIRRVRGLHSLREWNPTLWSLVPLALRPDRGVQSSILGFIPKDTYYIYHAFMSDKTIPEKIELEQQYLTVAATKRHYWPFEWTASFKWHCTRYFPLNKVFPKVQEPKNAKIVVFHGRPRPIDVVPLGNYRWGTRRRFGFGPVDWVRNYWLRFDDQWTETPAPDSKQAA